MTGIRKPARRATIFLSESDHYRHHSLCNEIVERARRAGVDGCTVLRGIEGFAAGGTLHSARVLSLSDDLPLLVVAVDEPERIETFLADIDEVIGSGLVVVDDVDAVRYRGDDG
jgi:PII-like signaling protein